MNKLKDRHISLRQNIADSAHARTALVQRIRRGAVDMLLDFGLARTAQSNALRVELAGDRASRIEQVLSIRTNACSISAQHRSEHVRMGCQLRQRLSQSNVAVIGAVEALRMDFAELRTESLRNHRARSGLLRKALIQDRSDGARAVVELMRGFGWSHRQMARDQRAGLANAGQRRALEMSELRKHFYLARTEIVLASASAQSRSTFFENFDSVASQLNPEFAPINLAAPPEEAPAPVVVLALEAAPAVSAVAERLSLADRVAAILAKRPATWTLGAKPTNTP